MELGARWPRRPGATLTEARRATNLPDGPDDLDALPRVPAPRPWRWVAGAVGLVLAAQFGHGLVTNPAWEWGTFFDYLLSETVVSAVWVTVQLVLVSGVLGFALGSLIGAMRLSRSRMLRGVAGTYVWALRSVPLMVQLLFWFNLAYLYRRIGLGIPFGPVLVSVDTLHLIGTMAAAVIGLTLHQSAYAAEIIRGGVASVDPGQMAAAEALGIPRLRQWRRILLPQAMRAILPNAVNEIVSLLKSTSLVSVMAIGELFYRVQILYGRNGRVVPLLMVATVWYLALTTVLTLVQHRVERRFAWVGSDGDGRAAA
ncbi:amino acid ABC transporter permease [Micromonospora sp. MH99]|uniref:amino acid ABC transporter permease n=1 Tax=Micromonospora sp. MH99 TaxID=1945510 RepID=UPI001F44689F|nr:amino acid ABC transporter permease [Micromonospora sp. MH99]MCF0091241.1 L-cystine transport system permease protein TcyB [Micromonospora sp. MH99]